MVDQLIEKDKEQTKRKSNKVKHEENQKITSHKNQVHGIMEKRPNTLQGKE